MARKKSNKQLWAMLALIALVGTVILLLPACGSSAEDEATLVRAGDQAPDFTVEMFDGKMVTLSDMRGKVVLLNFWATWCPPCREELKRAKREIIDRFAGRDFVFLPISRGEERQAVAAFRKKMGYSFPMGLDPQKSIYDLYASNYIPRNFVIDGEGKVVLASVGYDDEEFTQLLLSIEKALSQLQNR